MSSRYESYGRGLGRKAVTFAFPSTLTELALEIDLQGTTKGFVISSFFSRLFAMILTLTFAGVTVCSAGDRAISTLPSPAVAAPDRFHREARQILAPADPV